LIQRFSGKRIADAAGDELRVLLAPTTPDAFVHDYWAKKPLFVKGFPEKFAGFFDAETFSRIVSAPGPAAADFLRASFDKKTAAGESAPPKTADEMLSSVFRANPDQAIALFDAGATLCASQLETRAPALATFLATIKRQLGYPSKLSFNAYLSPPQSGFNWHFDSRIASTLQIEGTKRWRFSNTPAIAWPRSNGSLRADGTAHYTDTGAAAADWERLAPLDRADVSEVLLEPGDLLILPAGIWHEACGGAEGSLALNLTFSPLSYTLLVRSLLDTLLTPEPSWRGPVPVLPGEMPGEVDPDGIAAITAMLSRAAAVLQSLRGDSVAVVRLWESFVHNANPGTPLPKAPRIPASPVVPAQRLRIRPDGNVSAMLADEGTRLCIVSGVNREIELSGPAVRFVQRILTEKEFVAGDCTAWGDGEAPFMWDDVQAVLTELMREGLLAEA
jgi:hypothetical protein